MRATRAGGNRYPSCAGLGYHFSIGSVQAPILCLSMVMDVWNRRILGVEEQKPECGELAKQCFEHVCRDEGLMHRLAAVLHSDHGDPQPQAPRRVAFEHACPEAG